MKKRDIQQMQSSRALAAAIVDFQSEVQSELSDYTDLYSQDQIEWKQQINQYFQHITDVLRGVGSVDTLIGPEWGIAPQLP